MNYYNFGQFEGEYMKISGHPDWFIITKIEFEDDDNDGVAPINSKHRLNVSVDTEDADEYGLIQKDELKRAATKIFKELAKGFGYSQEAVDSIKVHGYYGNSFDILVSDQFRLESDPFYRFSMNKIDNSDSDEQN